MKMTIKEIKRKLELLKTIINEHKAEVGYSELATITMGQADDDKLKLISQFEMFLELLEGEK